MKLIRIGGNLFMKMSKGAEAEIKAGTKIESEHKETYNFLNNYIKKNGKLPPEKEFYKHLAENHVNGSDEEKGIIDYYTRLQSMEAEAEMKKAKAAVGSVATWADGKQYKKVSEGKWEPDHTAKDHGSTPSGGEKADVSTPAKLHSTFMTFLAGMSTEHRAVFHGGKMDFEKKTFTAPGGKVALKYSEGKVHVVKEMAKAIEALAQVLEKARVTKYIKRVPKPSGKGYYYFYTKQQFKDYKEKGIVPEHEKDETLMDKVLKFFGVKTGAEASKKIGEDYQTHKQDFPEINQKVWTQHVIEYLSHKDVWDAKLSAGKKESGPKPKTGEHKAEKKEPSSGKEIKADFKNFSLSIMRKVAGIYGGSKKEGSLKSMKGQPIKEEEFKAYLDTEKQLKDAESKGNEKRVELLEKQLQDQVKAAAQSYGISEEDFISQLEKYESKSPLSTAADKLGEATKKEKSADNFDSMPEGAVVSAEDAKKIKDLEEAVKFLKKNNRPYAQSEKELNRLKNKVKEDTELSEKDRGEYKVDKVKDEPGNELWQLTGKDGNRYRVNKTENGWRVEMSFSDKFSIIGSKFAKTPEEAVNIFNKGLEEEQAGKSGVMSENKGFDPSKVGEYSQEYKKFADGVKADIEKNNDVADYYQEKLQKEIKQAAQRIKSIKKEAQGTKNDPTDAISKFDERIKDASILLREINEIVSKDKSPLATAADKLDEKVKPAESKLKGNDIYSDENTKKKDGSYKSSISHGSLNYNNFTDPDEKKVFELFKPSNMIVTNHIKPLYDLSPEGQKDGVWTDSRMMILDKKITDEIYNVNKVNHYLKFLNAKNRFNGKGKADPVTPEEAKKLVEQKGEGRFPNWQQVVPKEENISKTPAKFTGRYLEVNKDKRIIEYSDGDKTIPLSADMVATIKNKFPNATIHLNEGGSYSPVAFKVGNEIKAVLMPLQQVNEDNYKNIKDTTAEDFKKPEKEAKKPKDNKLEKASQLLLSELAKAKAMPVGTISSSGKYKKTADGQWTAIKHVQKGGAEKKEPAGKDKKDEKKPEKKGGMDEEKKGVVRNALKKMASILADALSMRDVNATAAGAVEESGERIKKNAEINQKKGKETIPQGKTEVPKKEGGK